MPAVVDIAPSLGQGVVPLQAGPGSSPGYGAIDHRRVWLVGLQEGAISDGSYKVKQNSGGAAMNVDVDANVGDGLIVQGDDVAVQGRYYVAPHSAKMNITIDPADATNPRVDQIVCEVEDDTHDSSALNKGRVRVVKGAPQTGATLDLRSGAAALPNGCMRLADVLVGAGVTSITTANIRDRRAWALGAHKQIIRNADAGGTDDYTNAATTFGAPSAIDTTNLNPRIECSGVPLRATLRGHVRHSIANARVFIALAQDAAVISGGQSYPQRITTLGENEGVEATWEFTPVAGSHLFAPHMYGSAAGTNLLAASASVPCEFIVEERFRQNASND